MRKNILVSMLLVLLTIAFVGCNKDEPEPEQPKELVYADGTELNMAVVHNNTKTSISFKDSTITGTGLKLADGVTYQMDDLKPVWAELEKVLKVKFKDVYSGANSADNEFKVWKNLNFQNVDVLVGNADSIAEEGKLGKMTDLSTWLDYMPNLKKFLEDNPIVYLSVISDTDKGSIYYAPYFDGYDDIEKYFLMRTDWLEDLLDGSGPFTATTSDTFGAICGEAVYQPYMPTSGTLSILSLNAAGTGTENIVKNYGTSYGNIAKYMNDHVTATTTGVELVNMLRGYIDAAYGNKYGTKRSDLFAGYNACWDVDELVALLRCVVTNTYTLTGQNETKVTGIFPRENTLNRTSDLFSLVSMFGVRGYESRNNDLYFNADGVLCDARGQRDYAEAINKLNTLYKEKLIMNGFDTTKDSIYKVMYQQNLGFMIYDYCQTQSLYNADETTLKADADFNLAPVMNPVAKWFDGSDAAGKWMRFTESWRSVKTSGWAIPTTCTGDKLQAALKMFDYMYSTEGAQLMSYGPSAWRSGKTITYKGQQIPELSEAALDELWDLAGGNYTNYARMYLGSTLPIGFVKDQGMEYQCTTEGGKIGAAKVSAAIAAGTLKHVTPNITDNLFYTMVPTVLPTTATQDTILSGYAALGTDGLYSKTSGKYNINTEILKNGFGSDVALKNTLVTTMPDTADELVHKYVYDLGGSAYILIQQSAWDKIYQFYQDKFAE